MTICLVTDRRRLVPFGAPDADAHRCVVAQARHAVDAGVDLFQVRERDLEAAALARLVSDVVALTRRTTTRVVVNDRLDVALACGADGVHLRGDSIPVGEARRLAPVGFLIGRSVHSVEEAIASAAADYLIAGTVYPSRSKPSGHPLLGADGLRAVVRRSRVPVLAIGGITAERVDAVATTGAAGVAAIGLFAGDEGVACGAAPIAALCQRLRDRFDRVQAAP